MLYYSKSYVMSALPMLLWFFVSHVSLADMTVVLGVILTSIDMDHAKLIGL